MIGIISFWLKDYRDSTPVRRSLETLEKFADLAQKGSLKTHPNIHALSQRKYLKLIDISFALSMIIGVGGLFGGTIYSVITFKGRPLVYSGLGLGICFLGRYFGRKYYTALKSYQTSQAHVVFLKHLKQKEWKKALDQAPMLQHLSHPYLHDLIAIAKLNLALHDLRGAINFEDQSERFKTAIKIQLHDINLQASIFNVERELKDLVQHLKHDSQPVIDFIKADKNTPRWEPAVAETYGLSAIVLAKAFATMVRASHYQK